MAGAGRTMFVAGGSGFIGSNLCKEAVRIGFNVVSLSRTGRPGHIRDKWADQVDWIKGDVLKSNAYVNVVREVDAVVSCIGKFGAGYNNAVFEANADTNIFLAQLIHRECPNISKYGYISAQEYSMRVQKPFRSYFSSKQKAEKIIQSLFPKQYLILRPNWVYGWKHVAGPLWFPWQAIGAPIERILHPIADYCTHTKWVVPPTPVEELAHVLALGCTVGRDVSGYLPTMRVRDVIEREAQGRPLDDYLKPYILQVMKDRKEYFENVNYVEKYGLRNVGHKSYELAIMDARGGLNPAMTRPEFGHPIKGPAYLMDPFVTPEYRLMEKVEKEQMYLEGREKQLLFEARKKQETLDGERRLIGEKVASLPPNFDREKALPLSETRESKLESKRLKSITPGDFEWNLRNSNARARAIPY